MRKNMDFLLVPSEIPMDEIPARISELGRFGKNQKSKEIEKKYIEKCQYPTKAQCLAGHWHFSIRQGINTLGLV